MMQLLVALLLSQTCHVTNTSPSPQAVAVRCVNASGTAFESCAGGGSASSSWSPDGGVIGIVNQGTSPWVTSLASTTITSGSLTCNAGTNLNTSALALETSLVKLPLAQASTTSGQSGPLIQGAVQSVAPTYVTAQTSPLSLTPLGALRMSIVQHEFVFSTVNTTSAQLTASATFTGGCEAVLSQPAFSILAFSDQAGTLTAKTYQDGSCVNLIQSQVFTNTASAGISRSGVLNADYFQVSYQNTGGSTTTKLLVETAYGDILPSTQLNNFPISISEVSGTVVAAGNGVTGAGSQRVTIASDNTAFTVNAAQSGTWTARVVGNAGAVVDAANNAAAPANVLVGGFQLRDNTTATAGTVGQVGNAVASLDHVQYVRPGGPVNWSCFVQAVTATTQCRAAPAAGIRAYVTGMTCDNQAATVQTVDIVFGTGAACVTGTTALTHKYQMGTNATTTSPDHVNAPYVTPLVPTAANAICVRPSAATAFGCTLTGTDAP